MIISGDRLCLCYWMTNRSGSGPCNYSEIEKGQYGYRLEPGQIIYHVAYTRTGMFDRYYMEVVEANENEVTFIDRFLNDGEVLVYPWKRHGVTPCRNNQGVARDRNKAIDCEMYITPCPDLSKKYDVKDLFDIINTGWIKDDWVWYDGKGWSRFTRICGENLKYFVKLGQQELF